jgi:hypothetical protein
MPRRNGNVRQRNLPRAAQKLPRKGTQRALLDVREHGHSSRQPISADPFDWEIPDSQGLYSPLDSSPESHL